MVAPDGTPRVEFIVCLTEAGAVEMQLKVGRVGDERPDKAFAKEGGFEELLDAAKDAWTRIRSQEHMDRIEVSVLLMTNAGENAEAVRLSREFATWLSADARFTKTNDINAPLTLQ